MIAQADSRKWMACLYNSFLFMEAKIMKMAKKLLAVVLTGVMAVSMLTGCALGDAAKANALESALNSKNLQTGATSSKNIKYNYDHSLNDVAGRVFTKVYDKDETKITAPSTALVHDDKVDSTSKKYAYFVVEAPEKADMKHAVEWSVSNLDTAVKAATKVGALTATPISITVSGTATNYVVKNKVTSATATEGKVDFGVKFYTKTVSGTKTNYAIVVVELEKAAA